jgi:hypothetical protein
LHARCGYLRKEGLSAGKTDEAIKAKPAMADTRLSNQLNLKKPVQKPGGNSWFDHGDRKQHRTGLFSSMKLVFGVITSGARRQTGADTIK